MQIETPQYRETIVNVAAIDNANETPVCPSSQTHLLQAESMLNRTPEWAARIAFHRVVASLERWLEINSQPELHAAILAEYPNVIAHIRARRAANQANQTCVKSI